MDAVTKELHRIQDAIRNEIVTRRALAREAGLRDTVLTRVLEDDWNPTAETLGALSRALDAIEARSKKNETADLLA